MRTVDPEIWTKNVKKRVPSSLATYFMKRSQERDFIRLTKNEKVFRNSVRDTFCEYVKHTSIVGSKIITDYERSTSERSKKVVYHARNLFSTLPKEVHAQEIYCNPQMLHSMEIFYFLLLLAGFCGILVVLRSGIIGVKERPVVVTLESYQYPASRVMFPAVALCSVNLLSKKAIMNFTNHFLDRARRVFKQNAHRLPSEETMMEMVRHVGYLYDYEIEELDQLIKLQLLRHWVDGNDDIPDYELLKQLEPTCEDLLVRCSWRGQVVDCRAIFRRRKTSFGHCCTFNYVRKHNKKGEPDGIHSEPLSLGATGIGNGLSVIVRNNADDNAYQRHNSLGTDVKLPLINKFVLIFNPLDYPDQCSGALSTQLTLPQRVVHLDITSRTQYSTKTVKWWDLKSRGCRFRDELAGFHGHYSYSECVSACRARTAVALCRCTPYNASGGGGDFPKCYFEDIPCLHKHKGKFMYLYPDRLNEEGLLEESQDSLSCPECYPDCESVRYSVRSFIARIDENPSTLKTNFMYGLDVTNMTVIHAYYSSDDHLLFKMDVVYTWYELIGYIGDLVCLFAGVSMLSVLEIIYYCSYRFFVVWKRNRQSFYSRLRPQLVA